MSGHLPESSTVKLNPISLEKILLPRNVSQGIPERRKRHVVHRHGAMDMIGKVAGLPCINSGAVIGTKVKAYASTVELERGGAGRTCAALSALGFKAMKIRIHGETISDDLKIVDAASKRQKGNGFMADANQPPLVLHPERRCLDFHRALQMTRELKARNNSGWRNHSTAMTLRI